MGWRSGYRRKLKSMKEEVSLFLNVSFLPIVYSVNLTLGLAAVYCQCSCFPLVVLLSSEAPTTPQQIPAKAFWCRCRFQTLSCCQCANIREDFGKCTSLTFTYQNLFPSHISHQTTLPAVVQSFVPLKGKSLNSCRKRKSKPGNIGIPVRSWAIIQ